MRASSIETNAPFRFWGAHSSSSIRRQRPHLLVMGAASRPRWAYSAAGGTAAQILEAIACDLLVIKPPGFVSPLLVNDE